MAVDDPNACPPCRGTGQVLSTEGGQPHPVTCPWCEGSGKRRSLATDDDAPTRPR
jgi:DnaJ-class molecular chaperone